MLRSIFCLNLREANDLEDIKVKNWFWGAAGRIGHAADKGQPEEKGAPKGKPAPKPKPMPKPKAGKPAHTKLHQPTHQILAEACQRILGGYVPRGTKECISSSTNTANLVKSSQKESIKLRARFLEYSGPATQERTKYGVVLIEEGLGNLTDVYYYTREALESAVEVFNGMKIYADHPTLEDEEIRPERSARDILGHYENLNVREGANGCAQLCGDLDVLDCVDYEWARALMARAIENVAKFPDKPFIGLSINASGDAQKTGIDDVIASAPDGAKAKLEEAKATGIDLVKVVHKIKSAVSCDLVTEAGAGGKILNIIGDTNGQEEAG